jgi:hypothetical protein
MCIVITQPDCGNAKRRIRAVFAANFEKRIRPWAYQRIPQPKFLKPYRGAAGKADEKKIRFITMG